MVAENYLLNYEAPDPEEEEPEIDQEDFKKRYPTIIIPVEQETHNFSLIHHMRYFDLQNKKVWASDLTQEQEETLNNFDCKILQDYNPRNVYCYFVNKVKRSARFLIALITGIPIISASTLTHKDNVIKSKTLEYNNLWVELFEPSID